MAQLTEDEWPREQEPTTQEQQIPAGRDEAPVIGQEVATGPDAAVREGLHVSREPKASGTVEPRDRSGAGLDDQSRERTRDGATSGEWQTGIADDDATT